jgi:transposase
VPALPPYLIEPTWQQFAALLPEREVNHPLGCHRRRIPDRVVFEKLVQVLVFGCAYHRIADESCSATTLRERRVDRTGSDRRAAGSGTRSLRPIHRLGPF